MGCATANSYLLTLIYYNILVLVENIIHILVNTLRQSVCCLDKMKHQEPMSHVLTEFLLS